MLRRILIALTLLAFPGALFAQNDFGVWINSPRIKSTALSSDIPGLTGKLKFSQKVGFGVTYNHFSGPNISTEFAAQQIRSKVRVELHSSTINTDQDAGTIKNNIYSAVMKWHFRPRAFIVPYVGGGVAFFSNGQVDTPAEPVFGVPATTTKLKNKTTYVLDGGVNFGVTQSIAIGLDGRYSPFKARDKNDPADPGIKLDPFILSLGVRFRM